MQYNKYAFALVLLASSAFASVTVPNFEEISTAIFAAKDSKSIDEMVTASIITAEQAAELKSLTDLNNKDNILVSLKKVYDAANKAEQDAAAKKAQQEAEEEAAAKKAQQEATEQDAAAKKAQQEATEQDAAAKKAQQEAEEEAAAKKAQQEATGQDAATKKAQQEDPANKAEEEAAAKKAEEEAAAKKATELTPEQKKAEQEAAAKKAEEEAAAAKKAEEEAATKKAEQEAAKKEALVNSIKKALENVANFSELTDEAIKALNLDDKQIEVLKTAKATKTSDIADILNKIVTVNTTPDSVNGTGISSNITEETPFYKSNLFIGAVVVLSLASIGGGVYMMTGKSDETDL